MDLGIRDRVAFVAASTGGLGRAVAERLADEGARVAVTGRRAEVAREVAAGLPGALGLQMDLTEPRQVEQAVVEVEDRLGPVDILVLNGGGPPPAAALDVDADDLVQAVHGLLLPHQRLVRATVPGMRQRGWGRVVAIGSSGVQQPLPNLALSNALRAGLAGLLKTLAAEVAADGVTVNMVLPGRIATDRVASLDAAAAERQGISVDDARAASQAKIPARRYGTPDEFGAVAAFLCSALAAYVTGSQVRVDGGLIAST